MTLEIIPIYDATGANIATMPAGQHAGYVTGSGGVPWTAADWASHQWAVRIDQSPAPGAWDALADIQDVEQYAVTVAEVPGRIKAAQAAWHAAARPGQRWPGVYVGARPNMTPVVNALTAAGITGGVPFAIAAPGMSDADAKALIEQEHATPWPIIWVQNGWHATYDSGWADAGWLHAVSAPKPVPPPAPKPVAPVIKTVTVAFSDGTTEVLHM